MNKDRHSEKLRFVLLGNVVRTIRGVWKGGAPTSDVARRVGREYGGVNTDRFHLAVEANPLVDAKKHDVIGILSRRVVFVHYSPTHSVCNS